MSYFWISAGYHEIQGPRMSATATGWLTENVVLLVRITRHMITSWRCHLNQASLCSICRRNSSNDSISAPKNNAGGSRSMRLKIRRMVVCLRTSVQVSARSTNNTSIMLRFFTLRNLPRILLKPLDHFLLRWTPISNWQDPGSGIRMSWSFLPSSSVDHSWMWGCCFLQSLPSLPFPWFRQECTP